MSFKYGSTSLHAFTLSNLTSLLLSPLRKTFPSQHATLSGFAAVYISVSTSLCNLCMMCLHDAYVLCELGVSVVTSLFLIFWHVISRLTYVFHLLFFFHGVSADEIWYIICIYVVGFLYC